MYVHKPEPPAAPKATRKKLKQQQQQQQQQPQHRKPTAAEELYARVSRSSRASDRGPTLPRVRTAVGGSQTERPPPSTAVGRMRIGVPGQPATARSASNNNARNSQTLQPGSDEYYAFYLNRRKGKLKAEHELATHGWSNAEENNVVQPWLHDKRRRQKNAEGVQRKRVMDDNQLLLDLQQKQRARDTEEAKGLMMDLHRWIAGMTALIEKRATASYISDVSRTALRRDQLQCRSNVARLLNFTNVLAKGRVVNRNLLEQLRQFHGEVHQQKKVESASKRGRREGLPPSARLSELASVAALARSSGGGEDGLGGESLMDWKPVYEMDGISIGIRTYRSPKGTLIEDNTKNEVELLWKVRKAHSVANRSTVRIARVTCMQCTRRCSGLTGP